MTKPLRDPETGQFVSRRAAADHEQLRRLEAEIAAYPLAADLTQLIRKLRAEDGLTDRKTSEGRIYVKMAGIEAGARAGLSSAVRNWGNAARCRLKAIG